MELRDTQRDGVHILRIIGRFDAHEAKRVVSWFDEVVTSPPTRCVIALSEVEFIDSTALAALVQGMKRCRQLHGDVYLCALSQPVRTVFELTRLDRAFEIFAREDEAVTAFLR